MQSFYKDHYENEENVPILPRREKKSSSNSIILKSIYALLTVSICALIIFTFHQSSTSFSPNSSASAVTSFVIVVGNDEVRENEAGGNLKLSYTGTDEGTSNSNSNKDYQNIGIGSKKKSNNPVVKISSGDIRGTILKSRDGRDYFGFYGIPYAEPPIGKLRFQPPKPFKTKWRGIRDGAQKGGKEAQCVQLSGNEVGGTEDCLKLQVFTPKLPQRFGRNPKFPVMVYILGGGYKTGRANRYGAEYIMDEDVILVLIDFRVGNLGHLNTEDLEIRGNMGLKDQVMALRWIQENIKAFGGDPKKVLIFGNSSGGGANHGHIISKMSDGLFSRAASQSGTIVLAPEPLTRPLESAQYVGTQLNCTNVEDTKELHKCLLEADAFDIASIQPPNMHHLTKETVPTDGDLSDVFMPDFPINLLKQGKFKKDIPWVLGSNSAEGYMVANPIIQKPFVLDIIDKNFNSLAPVMMGFEDDNVTHVFAKEIRQLYFGSKPINADARWNLTNLLSDYKWLHPVKVAADYHALYGGTAYFYYLTHETIRSYGENFKEGLPPPYGVSHADEVQLLFHYPEKFPYISQESTDYNFSKIIVKVWADFARTGKPSVPNLKEWPALPLFEKNSPKTKWLKFNDTSRLMDPLPERMELMDRIPFMVPELYGAKASESETENVLIDSIGDRSDNFIY